MSNFKFLVIVNLIFFAFSSVCVSDQKHIDKKDSYSDYLSKHLEEWQKYARKLFVVGSDQKEIHNFFKKRSFRYIRKNYNSDFRFQMVYQVDDVTELIFDFTEEGKLSIPATSFEARVWFVEPSNGNAKWLRKTNTEN